MEMVIKALSHELSCYDCWELSFGLGKGKIVEEHGTEKHTVRGDLGTFSMEQKD